MQTTGPSYYTGPLSGTVYLCLSALSSSVACDIAFVLFYSVCPFMYIAPFFQGILMVLSYFVFLLFGLFSENIVRPRLSIPLILYSFAGGCCVQTLRVWVLYSIPSVRYVFILSFIDFFFGSLFLAAFQKLQRVSASTMFFALLTACAAVMMAFFELPSFAASADWFVLVLYCAYRLLSVAFITGVHSFLRLHSNGLETEGLAIHRPGEDLYRLRINSCFGSLSSCADVLAFGPLDLIDIRLLSESVPSVMAACFLCGFYGQFDGILSFSAVEILLAVVLASQPLLNSACRTLSVASTSDAIHVMSRIMLIVGFAAYLEFTGSAVIRNIYDVYVAFGCLFFCFLVFWTDFRTSQIEHSKHMLELLRTSSFAISNKDREYIRDACSIFSYEEFSMTVFKILLQTGSPRKSVATFVEPAFSSKVLSIRDPEDVIRIRNRKHNLKNALDQSSLQDPDSEDDSCSSE
eukprot:ANDGO_06895.mRNA.1 hypothetical protein